MLRPAPSIKLVLVLLAGAAAAVGAGVILRRPAPRAPAPEPTATAPSCAPLRLEATPPRVAPVAAEEQRWLGIGAVESRDQSQVSIEQDLALLRSVLGPHGAIYFAGGPGSRDVQVGRGESRGDPLLAELGALLAPRAGRSSEYRASTLPVAGAATLEELQRALGRLAAAPPASSLLLYIGGHGEQSKDPGQNYATLWGGGRLEARTLASWLDPWTRPVQLVVTTCFAGGFAEALFRRGDPARGPAPGRCGFFATTDDLAATGCDPNPDRRTQEGYAIHFLSALGRRDRDGRPLAPAEIDFDGDDRISLAEAHARTRMVLGSVDVPTSTSERWLREAAPQSGPRRPFPLPEERAVVRALLRSTGLPEDLRAVRRELDSREQTIEAVRQRIEALGKAEDSSARAAIAALLARWPELDDPWHPRFTEVLRCEREAIRAHLKASPAYVRYLEEARRTDEADAEHWELRTRAAPVERLGRALIIIERAERLHARGGAAWAKYQAILGCERRVP